MEVREILKISQQEFEEKYKSLSLNPETAKYVVAASTGSLGITKRLKTPSLSRDKILFCIRVNEEMIEKLYVIM